MCLTIVIFNIYLNIAAVVQVTGSECSVHF